MLKKTDSVIICKPFLLDQVKVLYKKCLWKNLYQNCVNHFTTHYYLFVLLLLLLIIYMLIKLQYKAVSEGHSFSLVQISCSFIAHYCINLLWLS